jgi:YfiH family protein
MSVDRIYADWPAPSNIVAGTTTRAGGASEFPSEPLWLNQVHAATVLRSDDLAFGGDPPDADASISSRANEVLAVRTADCLPVLLCTTAGDEVAAAHCGWRGLVAGILANTVATMKAQPADLIAWLGPAISQAAYEVGDDVREAFVRTDEAVAACFAPNDRGRWQADLYELARLQLAAAGVSEIYGGGFCTYADSDRFFSYRRDGSTSRMVSYIYRL